METETDVTQPLNRYQTLRTVINKVRNFIKGSNSKLNYKI